MSAIKKETLKLLKGLNNSLHLMHFRTGIRYFFYLLYDQENEFGIEFPRTKPNHFLKSTRPIIFKLEPGCLYDCYQLQLHFHPNDHKLSYKYNHRQLSVIVA